MEIKGIIMLCKKLLWMMSISLLFIAGFVNAATTDNTKQLNIIEDNDTQYVPWEMQSSSIQQYNVSDSDQDNYYNKQDDKKDSNTIRMQ